MIRPSIYRGTVSSDLIVPRVGALVWLHVGPFTWGRLRRANRDYMALDLGRLVVWFRWPA